MRIVSDWTKGVFMKLYIETKKSEKNNKLYTALYLDLGYAVQPLSYDRNVLMLVSNLSAADYMKATQVENNVIVIIDNNK